MFLGIDFNAWHFIIPCVVLLFGIPIAFWFNSRGIAFLVLALMLASLGLLQFWNEWMQVPSYGLYGGIDRFIANSKVDTRLFMFGSFAGMFGGFLAYIITLKLTKKG